MKQKLITKEVNGEKLSQIARLFNSITHFGGENEKKTV
jgi:hypothetical protein